MIRHCDCHCSASRMFFRRWITWSKDTVCTFDGAGVAQLVTTLQTSLQVRVRIPAIPKQPWLRGRGPRAAVRARWFQWKIGWGPLDE